MSEEKNYPEHKSHFALTFAVAAAVGAALGLMYAPKPGKELRKDLSKQATALAKKFKKTRAQVQEIVYDTFGKVTDELEKDYIEVRAHVLAAMEQMDKTTKLTQKKYNDIVKKAVKLYAKGRKWTEAAIQKLTKNLEKDWEELE